MILPLVDYIEVDDKRALYHFKCPYSGKKFLSSVELKPLEVKPPLWYEWVLHPFDSYKKYAHASCTLYSKESQTTMLHKAFSSVKENFYWDKSKNTFIAKNYSENHTLF